MEINRSNYEIWIIDWLDGNLGDQQVSQLKLFLRENPELMQEIDELNTLNLKPSEKSFPFKDHLKKSYADLSSSQFDYLCIAYFEKDLSAEQQTELKEMLDQYSEKKMVFELIQKIKLAPGNINYKHKNQLIKRTITQDVIRLSVIGLSAAAIIAFLILTYFIIPGNPSDININSAQNAVIDTILQKTIPEVIQEKLIISKIAVATKKQPGYLYAPLQKIDSAINDSDNFKSPQSDTLQWNTHNPEMKINKVIVVAGADFNLLPVRNNLIASKSTFSIPVLVNETSKLSKFIAKNFREKILKENTSKDSPLKAYEIAEAGVTGLNKLLGWEMTLDERTDENGELKSVYFSSKILKFNAPIKKSEPLP